jgi:hypothetical protein
MAQTMKLLFDKTIMRYQWEIEGWATGQLPMAPRRRGTKIKTKKITRTATEEGATKTSCPGHQKPLIRPYMVQSAD